MLIKVGRTAAINMIAVSKIIITEHEEVKKGRGLFSPDIKDTSIAVKIYYKTEENEDTNYTLYGFESFEKAEQVRNSVLSQIKELELEKISTELENAIRRS